MTNLLISLTAAFLGGMGITEGYLSQYAQGPTDGTWDYRISTGELPAELPPNTVLIATANCDYIGQWGYISIQGKPWEPMVGFDCAGHAHTTEWMRDDHILGEVDFYTARRHGFIDKGNIDARIIWINED